MEKLLWNLYEFYFCLFLEECVYPDDWKKSNVVPMDKKETKNVKIIGGLTSFLSLAKCLKNHF